MLSPLHLGPRSATTNKSLQNAKHIYRADIRLPQLDKNCCMLHFESTKSQCPMIDSNESLNLDQCKLKCLETEVCTAINYKPREYCERLECKKPGPHPTINIGNWKGYYISKGINIEC